MSASSNQEQVAKELTLSLINKTAFSIDHTEAAKEVGEMYDIILDAVYKAQEKTMQKFT